MSNNRLIRSIIAFVGISTIILLSINYYLFEILRPKMITFQELTSAEANLILFVGVSFLCLGLFLLISLYRLLSNLKNLSEKPTKIELLLIASSLLSAIFIMGNITLLSDIGKQYQHGLSQPEWTVLYILHSFQLLTSVALLIQQLIKPQKQAPTRIATDANIFMVVQLIGLICGSTGLSLVILNFAFPRTLWMIKIHILITTLTLLVPYGLMVCFWLYIKLREKPRQWYDEKQFWDIGSSALFTVITSLIIMTILFCLNYHNLEGVISVLWFPFYVFLTLFLFSTANLYLNKDYF